MMVERMITMRDVRAAGVCSAGARLFCQRYGPRFGFTWAQFKADGLRASVILGTGDAIGLRVVEATLGRQPASAGPFPDWDEVTRGQQ